MPRSVLDEHAGRTVRVHRTAVGQREHHAVVLPAEAYRGTFLGLTLFEQPKLRERRRVELDEPRPLIVFVSENTAGCRRQRW